MIYTENNDAGEPASPEKRTEEVSLGSQHNRGHCKTAASGTQQQENNKNIDLSWKMILAGATGTTRRLLSSSLLQGKSEESSISYFYTQEVRLESWQKAKGSENNSRCVLLVLAFSFFDSASDSFLT